MFCPFCVRDVETVRYLEFYNKIWVENKDYRRMEQQTAICDDCNQKLSQIVDDMRACKTEEEWLKTKPIFIHE